MFVTYIVVKLAMRAVVDECNRMASDLETQAQAAHMKSRVAQLEMDFAQGKIDEKTYTTMAASILNEVGSSGRESLRPDGGE